MINTTIGNTPLRKCDFLSASYNSQIYIKDESHNPGKSSKDRAAWFMMEDAIRNEKIKPGGTFVEASSGNTGISIAILARQMGYRAKIFVSKTCSHEKLRILESYGAEVELCDNSRGMHIFNSTQYLAQAYAANTENAYFTNQYYNSANIKAHYKTTGPELWQQSEQAVTHMLIGVGTGGSISGIGRFLKEQNRQIKIWGVEPVRSVYQGFVETGRVPEFQELHDAIEGIGRTFIPGAFDPQVVDRIFQVDAEESKDIAKHYYAQTNQLVGYSSAAVLACLEKYKEEMNLKEEDQLILFFPDHGDRYIQKLYKEKKAQSSKIYNSL